MNTASDLTIPLVVDLDGTLIRTDLLYESANHSLKSNPFAIVSVVVQLFSGKSALKEKMSDQFEPEFSELPINIEVVEWIKAEKKLGRKLVLATASHENLALQAAHYFGCFDEVLATNADRNLKSEIKRDVLVKKFGEKGFDYIGDAPTDKPVWKAARRSHVVSPSKSMLFWLTTNVSLQKIFDSEQNSSLKAFARALRPHQWIKNLLIFVPLLTAHLYTDVESVQVSLMTFVVFSIMASSVYLLNDLIDIADDRHHPYKRTRPFASGQLSVLVGWLAWPLLLLLAVSIGFFALPAAFTATLGIYYSLTLGYSFYFKRQPMVDVLLLAGLYTLRIVAGSTALDISLSFWLLSFSMFIFLSLAFMKRVNEIKSVLFASNFEEELKGRGHVKEDFDLLSSMGVASGFLSVVFLALYVQSEDIAKYYKLPELIWLSCPLLLFWIARAWLITHRGNMYDDPVLFVLKDKVSWITGGVFVLLLLLARYLS